MKNLPFVRITEDLAALLAIHVHEPAARALVGSVQHANLVGGNSRCVTLCSRNRQLNGWCLTLGEHCSLTSESASNQTVSPFAVLPPRGFPTPHVTSHQRII